MEVQDTVPDFFVELLTCVVLLLDLVFTEYSPGTGIVSISPTVCPGPCTPPMRHPAASANCDLFTGQ